MVGARRPVMDDESVICGSTVISEKVGITQNQHHQHQRQHDHQDQPQVVNEQVCHHGTVQDDQKLPGRELQSLLAHLN